MRGNPNPSQKLMPKGDTAMAVSPLAVRVPIYIDEYVRSLPDRTEWLRKAIARQMEEDLAVKKSESAY